MALTCPELETGYDATCHCFWRAEKNRELPRYIKIRLDQVCATISDPAALQIALQYQGYKRPVTAGLASPTSHNNLRTAASVVDWKILRSTTITNRPATPSQSPTPSAECPRTYHLLAIFLEFESPRFPLSWARVRFNCSQLDRYSLLRFMHEARGFENGIACAFPSLNSNCLAIQGISLISGLSAHVCIPKISSWDLSDESAVTRMWGTRHSRGTH